jgi:uncharacterized protein (TIGR00369 family)
MSWVQLSWVQLSLDERLGYGSFDDEQSSFFDAHHNSGTMTGKSTEPIVSEPTRDDPLIDPGIPAGFRNLVGYRTKGWREGYGEIHLDIKPTHLNMLGFVHGGVYATILDAALGHAVAWCGVPGNRRAAVTVSLTTTYLSGAKSGTLMAIGRLIHIEGRVATCTGEIRDSNGTLFVRGQASFMYLPGNEKPEGVPRPSNSSAALTMPSAPSRVVTSD